jgi:hypothetical protein
MAGVQCQHQDIVYLIKHNDENESTYTLVVLTTSRQSTTAW